MNLIEAMDAAFKFKIGDLVATRETLEHLRLEGEMNAFERQPFDRHGAVPPMFVVERQAQQCHGGVQRHYSVSQKGVSKDGVSGQIRQVLAEIELVPFAEVVEIMKQWKSRSKT